VTFKLQNNWRQPRFIASVPGGTVPTWRSLSTDRFSENDHVIKAALQPWSIATDGGLPRRTAVRQAPARRVFNVELGM
jgi:hypothetical protein